MNEGYNEINRRSVLKSASGLIGGSLMAGSAAAAKDKKAIGNQKANKFENSQIRSRSPMVRQK